MLAKNSKLKNSEEIKAILKTGQRIRGDFLTIFFQLHSGQPMKAAVVIGKKIAETAVRRNRVRRIIFSWLAKLELPATGNIVVMVGTIPADEKLLITDLAKCFQQLLSL